MPQDTFEIKDYLDAQLQIIHDLKKEGIQANGIYIRESPVPVSAITREFVISRLCSPRLQESAGKGAISAPTNLAEAKRERPKGTRALLVDVEATHDGLTKNYTFYPRDEMEKAAKTWLEPYLKPVITHHRNSDFFVPAEDPIGRVVRQEFKDSVLKPGHKTILIRHRITDPEAQQKIIDGRYATTSIGAIASSLHCSVCGNNLLENYCGHRRGQTYDYKKDENSPAERKLCYWIVGGLWYEEDSYVNTPADEYAQVVHFEWEEEAGEAGRESNAMENALTENLDELLAPPAETNADVSEHSEGDSPSEPADPEIPNVEESAKEDAAEGKQEEPAQPTMEERLAALEAENAELKERLTKLEGELQIAQAAVEEANAAKAEAEEELNAANAEIKQLTEKASKLVAVGRRQMIERVCDLQIAVGMIKEEERETLAASLAKKTPSELTEMAKTALARRQPRTPVTVGSPGQITAGEEVVEGTKNVSKELSLEDLAEAFEKAMAARNNFE